MVKLKDGREVYGIIYLIRNEVNNKIYIGQTTRDFNKRYCAKGKNMRRVYNYHNDNKNRGCYYNKHLLSSIDKYGIKNFKIDKEFDYAMSQEELDDKEKYWILYYDSFNNGYNRTVGGEGGGSGNLKIRESVLKKLGKKRIVCESEGLVFENYLDCIDYFYNVYGFKMKTDSLFNSCDKRTIYKPRRTKEKLEFNFRYAYDYILINLYNNQIQANTKFAVICVNDNNVFLKQKDCNKHCNINNLHDIVTRRKDYNNLNENKLNIMRYSNYIDTVDFDTVVELFYKASEYNKEITNGN